MANEVFYRGELCVTPPLSETDANVLRAVLNFKRIPETQAVFDAIAGSAAPDLPFYGGLLEVSDDGNRITPEEGESRHGDRLWLSILLTHFFKPRGYSVTGQIEWKAPDDDEDRGCIYVNNNQMDDVFDMVINPGPSWSRNTFADDHLDEVIRKLLDSADNTGCSPELTVVSAAYLEALKAIRTKPHGSQAIAVAA